jgi:DtxR family Mn-dependent transcriptional regulator
MKCTYCSKFFDEMASQTVCQSCTLFGGCHKIKCPHCGHEEPMPPEWIRKLGDRSHIKPLYFAKENQSGRVAYLAPGQDIELKKLLAMGVLPGESIKLLQKTPSFVFQIEYSKFAVDSDVAKMIIVDWS